MTEREQMVILAAEMLADDPECRSALEAVIYAVNLLRMERAEAIQ